MQKNLDKAPYKIVDVNEANIDKYDVFCKKSKKNTESYRNKVKWVRERFKEGLRLKLLLVNEGQKRGFRSRGFIEYIPGEYTWRGIDAEGYMVIHCIWVVGKNKKHGYGTKLLENCLNDAKGMSGVAVVTSGRTWLPRRNLFIKHGFEQADTMPPDFELLAKRFSEKVAMPRFTPISEERLRKHAIGIAVFKSDQCPYVRESVKAIEEAGREACLPVHIEHIGNCKEAQNNVHPYGTFCVLLNGKVITYHPIGKKTMLNFLVEAK